VQFTSAINAIAKTTHGSLINAVDGLHFEKDRFAEG
jgi:hypothetical protein